MLTDTCASVKPVTPSLKIILQEDCVTQEASVNWVSRLSVCLVNTPPSEVWLSASPVLLAGTVTILWERPSPSSALLTTSALKDQLCLLTVLLEPTLNPS